MANYHSAMTSRTWVSSLAIATPGRPASQLSDPLPGQPGKGGLRAAFAAEATAEIERLASAAAWSLAAGGAALEAAELAIRGAMVRLGASVLEHLLAADPGHRGARVECGAGHQA